MLERFPGGERVEVGDVMRPSEEAEKASVGGRREVLRGWRMRDAVEGERMSGRRGRSWWWWGGGARGAVVVVVGGW